MATRHLHVAQYSNLYPLPAELYAYVRGGEYLTRLAVYYRGDINYGGNVDISDLLLLAVNWGRSLVMDSA
jgi:hypothetical protein